MLSHGLSQPNPNQSPKSSNHVMETSPIGGGQINIAGSFKGDHGVRILGTYPAQLKLIF